MSLRNNKAARLNRIMMFGTFFLGVIVVLLMLFFCCFFCFLLFVLILVIAIDFFASLFVPK